MTEGGGILMQIVAQSLLLKTYMDTNEIEYLILGTGPSASVLSASLNRLGHSSVQIDKSEHYGMQMASVNISNLLDTKCFYIKNIALEIDKISDIYVKSHTLLDLMPCVLYSAGEMVQLLIESKVSRYLEFKPVGRTLVFTRNGILRTVPQTKEDIFLDKQIPLISKRRLMKFLTFIGESIGDDVPSDMSAEDVMREHNLDQDTQDMIKYCICFGVDTDDWPLFVGRMRKYWKSVGKFAKSPFLYPIYGTGEITQAFCRFSAVYGGAHVLGCTKIKLDSDAQSLQVEYDDAKKIEFKYKKNLYSFNIENNFARLIAVFENKPFDDEFDDTGAQMLVFPPESIPHSQPIYGLILSSKTHCCLDGFYIIHLWCSSDLGLSRSALAKAMELFQSKSAISESSLKFKCFFEFDLNNTMIESENNSESNAKENCGHIFPDMDSCVQTSKELIKRIYPDFESSEKLINPPDNYLDDF